jgi:hypothetical protein
VGWIKNFCRNRDLAVETIIRGYVRLSLGTRLDPNICSSILQKYDQNHPLYAKLRQFSWFKDTLKAIKLQDALVPGAGGVSTTLHSRYKFVLPCHYNHVHIYVDKTEHVYINVFIINCSCAGTTLSSQFLKLATGGSDGLSSHT